MKVELRLNQMKKKSRRNQKDMNKPKNISLRKRRIKKKTERNELKIYMRIIYVKKRERYLSRFN